MTCPDTDLEPDAESFKRALGSWASGVSIVTTWADDQPHGMTATAFSSVSLHPPLVSICVTCGSTTERLIRRAGVFCVNILSAGQSELSDRFAGRHGTTPRFEGISYVRGTLGCPVFHDMLASIECTVSEAVTIGDHVVCFGQARDVRVGASDPLLYFRGAYQRVVYGRRRRSR